MGKILDKIANYFGYVPLEEHHRLIDELEHVEECHHDLVNDSAGYAGAFRFLSLLGFTMISMKTEDDEAAGTTTGYFNIQYDDEILAKALEGFGFTLTKNEHFNASGPVNPVLIDTTKDQYTVSPPATEVVTEEIDDPDPLTVASDPDQAPDSVVAEEMAAKRFDDTAPGEVPPASSE